MLWIQHLAFAFVFGLLVGSFLNVVIARLLLAVCCSPPSHCPCCGTAIRPYDNVPIVSWLALGRKCRAAKNPFSIYLLLDIPVARLVAL